MWQPNNNLDPCSEVLRLGSGDEDAAQTVIHRGERLKSRLIFSFSSAPLWNAAGSLSCLLPSLCPTSRLCVRTVAPDISFLQLGQTAHEIIYLYIQFKNNSNSFTTLRYRLICQFSRLISRFLIPVKCQMSSQTYSVYLQTCQTEALTVWHFCLKNDLNNLTDY